MDCNGSSYTTEKTDFQLPVKSRVWQADLQLHLGSKGAGRHLIGFTKVHNHFGRANGISRRTLLTAFLDHLQVLIFMFWYILKSPLLLPSVKYSGISSNNSDYDGLPWFWPGSAFCMKPEGMCVLLGIEAYKHVLIFTYAHRKRVKKQEISYFLDVFM